jgi:hypothetical protein
MTTQEQAILEGRIGFVGRLAAVAADHPRMAGEVRDAIRRALGPSSGELNPTPDELALLYKGEKIRAVVAYRERTGEGLGEAVQRLEAAGLKSGFLWAKPAGWRVSIKQILVVPRAARSPSPAPGDAALRRRAGSG